MLRTSAPNNIPAQTAEAEPSVTAVSVACAYTRALANHGQFSTDEYAIATHLWQKGCEALRGMNWVLSSTITTFPFFMQRSLFNSIVGQGYDETIMLRKRMLKAKIDTAIADGTQQIVFLGGGYDVRALMTGTSNPGVNVFELDRGPTRSSKIKGLKSLPSGFGFDHVEINQTDDGTLIVGSNLRYIECDVVQGDLQASLTRHGFLPDRKSLFIGEGLTMYLGEEDNQKLLATIYALMSPNSECLLSYMPPRLNMGVIEHNSLKQSKELYRCQLNPDEVIPFVNRKLFQVCAQRDVSERLPELGIDNTSPLRERYYLLQKSTESAIREINDVPLIDFPLPYNPALEPSSSCVLV